MRNKISVESIVLCIIYVLLLCPVAYGAWQVIAFSSRAIWWDEWEFVKMYDAFDYNHDPMFILKSLFSLHGALHRLVFSRTIIFLLAPLTDWDPLIESWIAFAAYGALYVVIAKNVNDMMLDKQSKLSIYGKFMVIILSGFMLFAPLTTSELINIPIDFSFTACALFVALSGEKLNTYFLTRRYSQFIFITVFAGLASLCSMQGIIVWPALMICIFALFISTQKSDKTISRIDILIMFLISITVCGSYFIGYSSESTTLAASDLKNFFYFLFSIGGGPFLSDPTSPINQTIGGIHFAVVCLTFLYLLWKKKVPKYIVPLMLILWAWGSSIAIAFGRADSGLAPRYVQFPMLSSIGLMIIFFDLSVERIELYISGVGRNVHKLPAKLFRNWRLLCTTGLMLLFVVPCINANNPQKLEMSKIYRDLFNRANALTANYKSAPLQEIKNHTYPLLNAKFNEDGVSYDEYQHGDWNRYLSFAKLVEPLETRNWAAFRKNISYFAQTEVPNQYNVVAEEWATFGENAMTIDRYGNLVTLGVLWAGNFSIPYEAVENVYIKINDNFYNTIFGEYRQEWMFENSDIYNNNKDNGVYWFGSAEDLFNVGENELRFLTKFTNSNDVVTSPPIKFYKTIDGDIYLPDNADSFSYIKITYDGSSESYTTALSQVFFDYGAGINENDSATANVEDNDFRLIEKDIFSYIPVQRGREISALRIDPSQLDTAFGITEIEFFNDGISRKFSTSDIMSNFELINGEWSLDKNGALHIIPNSLSPGVGDVLLTANIEAVVDFNTVFTQ